MARRRDKDLYSQNPMHGSKCVEIIGREGDVKQKVLVRARTEMAKRLADDPVVGEFRGKKIIESTRYDDVDNCWTAQVVALYFVKKGSNCRTFVGQGTKKATAEKDAQQQMLAWVQKWQEQGVIEYSGGYSFTYASYLGHLTICYTIK